MRFTQCLAVGAIALCSMAAQAKIISLAFTKISYGNSLSTLRGVDFSLVNGDGSDGGMPAIGYWSSEFIGLTNTTTGAYPSSSDLVFTFTEGTASDIRFSFDNWGSGNGSSYSLFDASGNLISKNDISDVNGSWVDVVGGGVKSIVFDNGQGNSGNSWEFAIGELDATITSSVPELPSTGLLLAGLAVVGAALRRRQAM